MTRSRLTSETSSATTTPRGDGPGFFSNKVYKPSTARQHDFRDAIRSKSVGDLSRSRLRSSDRSRGHSATVLAIEPLIEHEHDEDASEDLCSTMQDPNKSPRSTDVSSSHKDTSSTTNTVVTNYRPKLMKTTSAAILGAGKLHYIRY